jgi:hypothetical protein
MGCGEGHGIAVAALDGHLGNLGILDGEITIP